MCVLLLEMPPNHWSGHISKYGAGNPIPRHAQGFRCRRRLILCGLNNGNNGKQANKGVGGTRGEAFLFTKAEGGEGEVNGDCPEHVECQGNGIRDRAHRPMQLVGSWTPGTQTPAFLLLPHHPGHGPRNAGAGVLYYDC